jgi:O-antigen ligase
MTSSVSVGRASDTKILQVLLLLFMLVPSALLVKVWPISAGFSDGLALLIGGLLGGVLILRSDTTRFVLSPVLGLLLLFVLALGLSVAVNSYPVPAVWRWYFIFLGFSALLLFGMAEALEQQGTDRFVDLLLRYLWYGATIYAIASLLRYYGVLQLLLPSMQPSGERMGGMWTQANLNSMTLWLGLLAAVFCCSWQQKRWQLVGSVLLFGWGIACSASRVSWLFAAGLMLWVALASLPPLRMTETLAKRKLLAAAVVAVVSMLFLVPLVNAPLSQWLTEEGVVDRSDAHSLVERSEVRDKYRASEWQKLASAAPDMSVKELLVGVGPGRYTFFSTENDNRIPVEALDNGMWGNAHNIFLMVFVEAGLVGLAALLAIFGSIGWQILKRPVDNNRLFLAGAIGLLLIHSNVEFPLWYAWFLMLFGLLLLPLFDNRKAENDSRWTKPFVGAMCVLITVITLVSVGTSYASFGRIAHKQSHDINDFMQVVELSGHGLFGPYASLWRYREFAPVTVDLQSQLDEVERIVHWQPRDLVMLRQYSLYLMADRLDDACDIATQTARRYPGSAPFMIDHVREKRLAPASDLPKLQACIEDGLSIRGKTLTGVRIENAKEAMAERLRANQP